MDSFRSFASAWLVGIGLALMPAAEALAESAPVRLVAPRAGDTLMAGSSAELEWAPLEPFARLPRVEEWEAFLSFDGGATYPVRITPHLDHDLRRVRWQVPAIPTADARLLLRFGDEHRESHFELPQRFSIAAAPGAEWAFALAGAAPAAGEPALPGQPGVVAWVEGSRRGGSLRQVTAPERPALRPTFTPPESGPQMAALDSEAPSVHPPAPTLGSAGGELPPNRGALLAGRGRAVLPCLDILLLTQRQNE